MYPHLSCYYSHVSTVMLFGLHVPVVFRKLGISKRILYSIQKYERMQQLKPR